MTEDQIKRLAIASGLDFETMDAELLSFARSIAIVEKAPVLARVGELEAQTEMLRQELKNIANADTIAWDDPTEFEPWAKSRARHALEKTK